MRRLVLSCLLGAALGVAPALGPAAEARPAALYLPNLSFVAQTYNNCGPASIVSVLGYYGIAASQDALRQVLRPNGGYMTAGVIDPFLKPYGLRATRFKGGNIEHLRRLIEQGIPVIVLQWLDRVGGIPHFRVVRGYDDKAQVMWLSDPIYGPNVYVNYTDFERLWGVYGQEFIPVYPQNAVAKVEAALGVKNLPRN